MLSNTKFEGIKSDETTIISNGVKIAGKITCSGNIRVDGEIQGDIVSQSNITIGELGQVNGQINGEVVTIGGKVSGTVIAKEKLVLDSGGNLKGDLFTKNLSIEAGAKFDGKSKTGDLNDMKEIQNIIKQSNTFNKMPMNANIEKS
ncbi:MAG: bactofilin family protein [Candidatus Kariarchaeaceae archaeon]|jgi:cytoskeletal protein CcmA (bactofilin family)